MPYDRRRTDHERRRTNRVSAVFAVKNTVGQSIVLAQAEDIGPTGMTLRWPKDASFTPSLPVALTFALPGCPDSICARGLVMNARPTGRYRRTGVRFTGLEPHDAALIEQYCAARR
jgi:hypothetical protein